jgi:cysteine desulfuration protein SufE
MTSISEKQNEIIEKFKSFDSWESKYKHIIELGKNLKAMPEELKTETYKVKGCQSQVWLFAKLEADQSIDFAADSDALIVKGLIALLVKVYSGEKASEIIKYPPLFIQKIDLGAHLSPSRANGLNSMIKQIMNYAIAFEMIAKSNS